jgi:diphthine synthase
MSISQIPATEASRRGGIFLPDHTLAIALSRIGGGEGNERIVYGTLSELLAHSPEAFGEPLHSLIIVGRRLHPLEVEYAKMYAIHKETWRGVGVQTYGCNLG